MTGDTTNICFACSRSSSCMESLATCTNNFVRVLTFLSRLGCRKLRAQNLLVTTVAGTAVWNWPYTRRIELKIARNPCVTVMLSTAHLPGVMVLSALHWFSLDFP